MADSAACRKVQDSILCRAGNAAVVLELLQIVSLELDNADSWSILGTDADVVSELLLDAVGSR